MTRERKEEIEQYIGDWHWDIKSHKFAFKIGTYLFEFKDFLKNEDDLSERTIKKHSSNCWAIGILTCQYGYHDTFTPEVFKSPPYHSFEFSRKFSDSKNATQSYSSTCRRLKKYALKKGDIIS